MDVISMSLGMSLLTLTQDFYTVVRRKATWESFKHNRKENRLNKNIYLLTCAHANNFNKMCGSQTICVNMKIVMKMFGRERELM